MSAALAVKQAMCELSPDTECLLVDTYEHASRFFGKMATQGYIHFVKYLPRLYNFFYEQREKDSTIAGMKSKYTESAAAHLMPLIDSFSPDVIVCTHAFPSGVASLIKESRGIPVVNVVTDFVVHPFWIHPNSDLYLVGEKSLAAHLSEQGIGSARVEATGIPVDVRFGSTPEKKSEIRRALGLDPDLDTVLVMGGGVGLGPIGWILRALRKVKHPIQVAVLTGTNRGLRKRMERQAARLNRGGAKRSGAMRSVKVYGYVNNVYDFMKAADLLISKPGGLTSSEALVAELPLVIAGPLPGPEVRNAAYLAGEKAAVMVKRRKNIARSVDFLFGDRERIARLKERARSMKKPDAARDAARLILELAASRHVSHRSP